jgi:hypothetical protein
MDDVYKQLLGKIFQSIAPGASDGSSSGSTPSQSTSSANMENQLDNLLSSEKAAFTPGFLRHVEGECFRIASLSTMSPESVKMLQILRLIQTRVLEELGKASTFTAILKQADRHEIIHPIHHTVFLTCYSLSHRFNHYSRILAKAQ